VGGVPVTAADTLAPSPPTVLAYYAGQVVDMTGSGFKLACMRVVDNSPSGYVLDGAKLYQVSRAVRVARRVVGEEHDSIIRSMLVVEEAKKVFGVE
jgi:hypothetical protein